MATLVLSTVGQIVGGPVGGAIGAAIGQQIDARLFAPKARHGPRLGELAVQTSAYGTQIPKVFGTLRVAGTVIWSTDLQEQKETAGGGKGRPKTVTYSYSASFAVALSGQPAGTVGRIWADGKLLRGAAGDFKSEVGAFRLHPGDEDQAPDPLIVAAEGAGGAPAYRGIAYAVFEDLQLADFGNRIPSLTFELVAGAGTSLRAVAEALSGGEVGADDGAAAPLVGYAASGDSVRSAIQALSDVMPLGLVEDEGRLKLTAAGGTARLLLHGDAFGAGSAGGRMESERAAAAALPAEVTLAFYDPARDFQTGLQRASLGNGGLRGERRALPAALGADAAKALAEWRLADGWAARRRIKAHLPWRDAGLRPGDPVRVAGQAGLWRITGWSLEKMVVTVQLAGAAARSAGTAPAGSGRPTGQPDLLHGETRLVLLDLPLEEAGTANRPVLLAAAAGTAPGWRAAALQVSFDGGGSWEAAGRTAAPAVMGTLVDAPPPAGSALFDLNGSVLVQLWNDGMWLESRDDRALAQGANLAALGDELLQFGSAEPLGGGLFRLSRLLRGRRGTEWAQAHAPGEPFVLLARETVSAIEAPAGAAGGDVKLLASGLGDGPGGVAASRPLGGEALRPPSPVHLRGRRLPGGDVELAWVRRSRAGWAWADGADTPLGEEREAYRVTLNAGGGGRAVATAAPTFTYTAAHQAEDGAAGAVSAEVVQIGTFLPSRAALITII